MSNSWRFISTIAKKEIIEFTGRMSLPGQPLDRFWIPGQPLDRSWTPGQPMDMSKFRLLFKFGPSGSRLDFLA